MYLITWRMEEVGIGAPRKDWMNGPFRGALFMRPGAVLDRTLAVLPHLSNLWTPPHNAPSYLVPRGWMQHNYCISGGGTPLLGEFLKWGHLDLWAELMIAKAAVYYRINEHRQPHLPCLLSIHNILIKKVFMDEPILSKFNAQIRESTILTTQFSSVRFSRSIVSDSLWPRGPQHSRPPCPSPTPRVYSNSCPLSWRCHPPISSSVVSFSSCLQSFPASGAFLMSQLFASGGQSIGVSASTSVLLMNTQDWSPLGWTGWISLQPTRRSNQIPPNTL